MFCVECGKEETLFRNGMCVDCYIKKNHFSKAPKNLTLFSCPHCGSYKHKNMWISESFDHIMQHAIQDSFTVDNQLNNVSFIVDCKEKNYFEAILQIRADKRKLTKKELTTLMNIVETLVNNIAKKGDRDAFITDTGKIHGGLDFYLSKNEVAHIISKNLHERFGGELKTSPKLVGRKDGRDMYRMTYLVRLPVYRKGDFVSISSSFYIVSSISRSRINLINLSTWKTVTYSNKSLEDVTVHGGEELITDVVLVSQSKCEVQVMDQKTYNTVEISKPISVSFDSKTVKIVKLDDKLFLIPDNIFKYYNKDQKV
jgi:nonsense-mediated mRNA decay protein 3